MSSTERNGTPDSQSGQEGAPALGLRVQGATRAQIDQLTRELQDFLQRRTEDVKLERRRENPGAQDAGALLVAVLAAPAIVELAKGLGGAAVELAKGIADFMRMRQVSVEISADGGPTKVAGRPEQVERIVHELLAARLGGRRDS